MAAISGDLVGKKSRQEHPRPIRGQQRRPPVRAAGRDQPKAAKMADARDQDLVARAERIEHGRFPSAGTRGWHKKTWRVARLENLLTSSKSGNVKAGRSAARWSSMDMSMARRTACGTFVGPGMKSPLIPPMMLLQLGSKASSIAFSCFTMTVYPRSQNTQTTRLLASKRIGNSLPFMAVFPHGDLHHLSFRV